jgi:hypothetical protein
MNDHEMMNPPTSATTTDATAKPAISLSDRARAAEMLDRRLAMRASSAATSEPTSASIFW